MSNGRISVQPATRIALERRVGGNWKFLALVPEGADEERLTLFALFGGVVGFSWFSAYPALPVEDGLPSDVAVDTRGALEFRHDDEADYCHLAFAEFQRFDLSQDVRHTILIPVSDAHEYVRSGTIPGWSFPCPSDSMLRESVALQEALENARLGGRRCRVENVTTYRSELRRWLAGLDDMLAKHGATEQLRMVVRRSVASQLA